MIDKENCVWIPRSIFDDWPCKKERMSQPGAWFQFCMFANLYDEEIKLKRTTITIHNGQFLTTKKELAEEFLWEEKEVTKYLKFLKKAGMATYEKVGGKLLITLSKEFVEIVESPPEEWEGWGHE